MRLDKRLLRKKRSLVLEKWGLDRQSNEDHTTLISVRISLTLVDLFDNLGLLPLHLNQLSIREGNYRSITQALKP